jgi:hypothetical protein
MFWPRTGFGLGESVYRRFSQAGGATVAGRTAKPLEYTRLIKVPNVVGE